RGSIVAKKACDAIGKPYIWAAAGPNGYDCSGLALAAWGSVGVTLGHYTGWQWLAGTPVTRDELRPGDLVFYFRDLHHVAIYVGGSASENGSGPSPATAAGPPDPPRDRRMATSHSLRSRACQTIITRRPAGRSARPMFPNAATGSAKNIVPNRLIATVKRARAK